MSEKSYMRKLFGSLAKHYISSWISAKFEQNNVKLTSSFFKKAASSIHTRKAYLEANWFSQTFSEKHLLVLYRSVAHFYRSYAQNVDIFISSSFFYA